MAKKIINCDGCPKEIKGFKYTHDKCGVVACWSCAKEVEFLCPICNSKLKKDKV